MTCSLGLKSYRLISGIRNKKSVSMNHIVFMSPYKTLFIKNGKVIDYELNRVAFEQDMLSAGIKFIYAIDAFLGFFSKC